MEDHEVPLCTTQSSKGNNGKTRQALNLLFGICKVHLQGWRSKIPKNLNNFAGKHLESIFIERQELDFFPQLRNVASSGHGAIILLSAHGFPNSNYSLTTLGTKKLLHQRSFKIQETVNICNWCRAPNQEGQRHIGAAPITDTQPKLNNNPSGFITKYHAIPCNSSHLPTTPYIIYIHIYYPQNSPWYIMIYPWQQQETFVVQSQSAPGIHIHQLIPWGDHVREHLMKASHHQRSKQ